MEISTKRLILRPFRVQDLEETIAVMGDPAVGRWLPKGDGYTREESTRFIDSIIAHWTEHGFGVWAVVERETHEVIGHCGLNLIPETMEVEVLYAFAPWVWGQGYATEAAIAALRFGFETLRVDRIIGLTKPANSASRRVLEKIGLRYQKTAQYFGIQCAYYDMSREQYEKTGLSK